MREFAESVEPERLSDELQNAIRGAGAFRYFKDTLRRYRREKIGTPIGKKRSARSPSNGARKTASSTPKADR